MDSYDDVAADLAGAARHAYACGQLDDELEHLLNEGLLDENDVSEDDLERLGRRARREDDEPDGGELGVHLEDRALYVASELVGSEDGNVTIEELAYAIFEDPRFPARMALERVTHLQHAPGLAVRPRRLAPRRARRRSRTVRRARARSPGRKPGPDPEIAQRVAA